jgi:hypothetical protein
VDHAARIIAHARRVGQPSAIIYMLRKLLVKAIKSAPDE